MSALGRKRTLPRCAGGKDPRWLLVSVRKTTQDVGLAPSSKRRRRLRSTGKDSGSARRESTIMAQQVYGNSYGGGPAENYQRYFVPSIGAPVAE